jgi:uncharacterized protein
VARRVDLLEEVAGLCVGAGVGEVVPLVLDLASHESAQRIADALISGIPAVLVSNAGIADFGDFAEMPLESHLRQLEVNLIAPMRLIHAALPAMMKGPDPQIIQVLSIAATTVFAGAEAYSASKAGALAFGRSLSLSYRKQGLRVTNILPGATDTMIWGDRGPLRSDMLRAESIGEAIRWLVNLPTNQVVEELTITPPLGIL